MSDEKTSLSAALRHLAEQERRTPAEHATPGELAAYQEGTLPPQIEARVREHLSHCKLCSDLLLDLAGFADLAPPPGVPELTDAEVEEDWRALWARMGEPAPVVPFPTPAPRPGRRPWRYAMAAALVAAAVGLTTWTLIPTQPLPPHHFYEGGILRGEDESPLDSMTSREPAAFHFYPESYPRYEGRILRGRDVIWTTSEVKRISSPSSNDWDVSFEIPGGSLKPGVYRAVLYGLEQGRSEAVGSIEFEVDDP